jgi:membrane-bound metal-dependent hydrolase YbcI (DUF457 family)
MPSPLAHGLAGIAIALFADRVKPASAALSAIPAPRTLAVGAAALAMLPDADLLLASHRTWTHSIVAALLVMIIAAAVTGWVTRGLASGRRRRAVAFVAILCGAAYGSHIPLDWLGSDWFPPVGIQIFWPFSDRFFISGLELFARVERRDPLSWETMVANGKTALQEVAIMLPVVWASWLAGKAKLRTGLRGR